MSASLWLITFLTNCLGEPVHYTPVNLARPCLILTYDWKRSEPVFQGTMSLDVSYAFAAFRGSLLSSRAAAAAAAAM